MLCASPMKSREEHRGTIGEPHTLGARTCLRVVVLLWLTAVSSVGRGEEPPSSTTWIDAAHASVYNRLWRSAMGLDRYFGSQAPASVYQEVYGSIAPAVLWDQFRGFQEKLRFDINAPLPQLSERVHAVLGRVNRDEYVAGRAPASGAFQRQYGPQLDDQTILGLVYRAPARDRDSFGVDAGVRVRSPLDPYVKGDYTYVRGVPTAVLYTFRQSLFWQQSEHLGTTSRFEMDHFLSRQTLLRFTTAGTLSQKSAGLRGYAALTAMHSMPRRRAISGNLSIDWESRAPVALHEFGVIVAYRQSVFRDWLILEVRSGVTWPKELPGAARMPSWGLGMGFEMLFGTTQFQARPITF